MGDPDLSTDGETRATPLADPIRAGDGAAIAGFRDARLPRVEAYVAQVCPPELADEAVAAAFVDFLARVADAPVTDAKLDGLLLAATRSAAAGRFTVASAPGRSLAIAAECNAMPELLAVHANGERAGDEALIAAHLAGCSICTHTLARMQDAERAFAKPSGELPALELRETEVDTAKPPPPRPTAAAVPASAPSPTSARRKSADTEPKVEPQTPPGAQRPAAQRVSPSLRSPAPAVADPPPVTRRRRSGGLVGAIRRLSRPPRG
jgi:hypothetical protein